jgi:outer membrane protein assembly factor BamD (BamD/ComL family)
LTRRAYYAGVFFMLTALSAAYNDAKSAPEFPPARNMPPVTAISAAQSEFTKGNWNAAITLYKKHLRSIPNDLVAWNQLAAAYYHSGQIKLALETLRRFDKTTPDKSFNYFYQGMCVAILGSDKDAVKFWEYATNWADEFGARATFELAIYAAKDGDIPKTKQWLQTYLQKFPRGPDANAAKEQLRALSEGKKPEAMKGFDRPDPEATIYKYHPWSLFQFPHFWEIQTGFTSSENIGYQPGPLEPGSRYGTIERRNEQDTALLVNASIGVGPIRKDSNSSFAGYTYKQNWLTQPDSLPNWISDGFSLDAFPIRGDMMERTHQLFGDFRRQASSQIYMGAYARVSFSRIGSSFFPSPDDSNLRVVTSDVDTSLIIPWVGWSWSQTSRSMLSLYLRKEIHNQSPEHSNKTYDLSASVDLPAISFGFAHGLEFPSKRLELSFDLYQYEFIFNDFWLDYTRRAALAAAEYTIYRGIGASVTLGYYQDSYKLPYIKTGSCSGSIDSENPIPVACIRADTGNLIHLNVYYEKSQNLRFDLSYQMVENSSGQKVYSESKNSLSAGVVWAFPGTRRVAKMTKRFADVAFTKDTEQ